MQVTDLESTGESSQAKLTEYQTTLEKLSQEFQFCVKGEFAFAKFFVPWWHRVISDSCSNDSYYNG